MYQTILADPPWHQKAGRNISNGYIVQDGKQIFKAVSNTSENLPYSTMTIEQIAALPIKDIAAKNAHLYLWVTNKYLLDAKQIIKAWGFTYSTALTWCKQPLGGGLGGAFTVSTEHLLFCRRGSLKALKKNKGTWHQVKRPYENGAPVHSRKPEYFRELIMQTSPGPYLELFARKNVAGWDAFGNEVEQSIKLL